jgi:hypothetical protein
MHRKFSVLNPTLGLGKCGIASPISDSAFPISDVIALYCGDALDAYRPPCIPQVKGGNRDGGRQTDRREGSFKGFSPAALASSVRGCLRMARRHAYLIVLL